LPVRTAETIKSVLESSKELPNNDKSKKTFSILSNPEFLAEGTAIEDLKKPDRILIGGEDQKAIEILKKLYLSWVPQSKILCTNLWSSELSKLMANAFLAQRISSINTVSAICEETGANVHDVSKAIGMDSRIGFKFLNSGPGFGGSCFKKDILNIVYLCRNFGLNEVAEFWESVIKINTWQKDRIYKILVEKLYGNLSNKIIAILGFAFKANTNDTRESPAISICGDLLKEGAILNIHDPKVDHRLIKKNLDAFNSSSNSGNNIYTCKTVDEAVLKADAILILTDWDEYKSLNFRELSKLMRKPAWVFDTRGVLDIQNLDDNDLNLWKLGIGT